MRARQIADPQAEWTTKLGHTEKEQEKMREEREMFCVCSCVCMCVCEEFSDTQ